MVAEQQVVQVSYRKLAQYISSSAMCAQVLGAEPGFTSCHGRVIATLDYMWYTRLLITPSPAAQKGAPRRGAPDLLQSSSSADAVGSSFETSKAASSQSRSSAAEQESSGSGASNANAQQGRREQPAVASPGASGSPAVAGGWALVPTRVAMVPPLRSLRSGLPAPEYPSDHISLVAEFSARSLRPVDGLPVPDLVVPRIAAPATAAGAVPSAPAPQLPRHVFFDDDED